MNAIKHFAIFIAGGIAAGWSVANHYQAEIADMRTAYAQEKRQVAEANLTDLRAAKSLGDVLSNHLASAEATINQVTLEKSREIHHYATGNVCLNAELVSLLDATETTETSVRLPSSAILFDAEDEAATTIKNTLTDKDVARWINTAKSHDTTCVERLNNLIDFNKGVPHDGREQ